MKTFLGVCAVGLLVLAACSSPSEPGLPEGWRRVQVREGYVGRELPNPLAGFTIDLPPGWEARESWPQPGGPTGHIWRSASEEQPPGRLRFSMGVNERALDDVRRNPRAAITTPVVGGEPATVYLPTEEAGERGSPVGVFFARVPGAPPGEETPSLWIHGISKDWPDLDVVKQVLTSVRYAELEALPELAPVTVTPVPDWQRLEGGLYTRKFTILTPPGWQIENRMVEEGPAGWIKGDGIELHYDFTGMTGAPYQHPHEPETPPHRIWEERVGPHVLWMAQPLSPEPHPRGVTATHALLNIQTGHEAHLGLVAVSLTAVQQELVLAMFRTVELVSPE